MRKSKKKSAIHLSLLLATALACDSKAPADEVEPVIQQKVVELINKPAVAASQETTSAAIGSLDRDFVAGIREHSKVEKIELEIAADGVIRELALYHNDADRIPAAVRKLAESTYPGATITGFESEVEGPLRHQTYEVELKTAEGQECEIEAGEDGVLLYTECSLDLTKLSKELKAAAAKALPDGTIKEAEVVTHSDDTPPETVIEIEVGESTHKLIFVGDQLKRHALEIEAEIELDLPLP